MASRLFRAIVGFGVAMGTATAACGEVEGGPAEADAGAKAEVVASPRPDAAFSPSLDASVAADALSTKEASIDVMQTDASSDSAFVLDAFCDAPWPTTKGSPPINVACIDPLGECANIGEVTFSCSPAGTSIFECPATPLVAARCQDGSWQCPTGTRPSAECMCFEPIPVGWECTDAGLALADSG